MTTALVLMGGGARTAYQAGVLLGVAQLLRRRMSAAEAARFPFPILLGSSAGALNAAFLAGRADSGLLALEELAQFWAPMRSSQVYRLNDSPWIKGSRWLAALSLGLHVRRTGALLNNEPLVSILQSRLSLVGIESALQSGALQTLAVTASSYTSGRHWTFYQDAHSADTQGQIASWSRPGRLAMSQVLSLAHFIASSAVPLIFPPVALSLGAHTEFFGDGSMNQVAPLAPAIHLGAQRILLIGVYHNNANAGATSPELLEPARPSLGVLGAHLLDTVFFNAVESDLDLCRRINRTLAQAPADWAAADVASWPYRPIEVLSITPSRAIDELAQAHADELPAASRLALGGVGALRGHGAALASYLLFEPGFLQALIDLGVQDAWAQADELYAFFAPSELV